MWGLSSRGQSVPSSPSAGHRNSGHHYQELPGQTWGTWGLPRFSRTMPQKSCGGCYCAGGVCILAVLGWPGPGERVGGLPRKSLGRPQDQGGQFLSGTSGQSSRIDLCSQALSTRSRIGGGTCHVSLDTLLFRVLHSVSLQVHPEQAPTPCTFSAHTLSGPLPQGKQSPLGPFSLPCSQQGSLNQHWPAW